MKEHSILRKGLIGLIISALLIFIDQLAKNLAVAHLKGQEPIVLWKGVFELRYLENRGAAFGILQDQRMFFLILTSLVLILIIYVYLKKLPNEHRFLWLNIIAVLFFAGAIGNFIDRFMQDYVVDFFYFCLIDFPIFNVADIYVTVAAFLLILLGFFYYKEEDFERIFPSKKKESV
ncbi:MAG: signal peptidase II [Clostridiales bacterium]|nr:signal peptidase II [Roseburia sp.]MDD7635939.1 signal peptidase II [Clostridiales bacterium]MDY4111723.1 signal peptidase II [Roseburia sp.]